jgi:hypothetical protein
MKPETLAKLSKILPASFNGDVGRATTWADEIKRSKGYAGWSGVLHYSDAEDSPPTSCSYDYKRDCPDGNCVVGAIANYTQRLGCRNSAAVREEAAKFLTHFIGDITQPLHLCGRDKGGNEASVRFDGKSRDNLHSIWDTSMLAKKMKVNFGNSQPRYLDYLLKLATSDKDASNWASCLSKSGNVALNCPIEWASDSDEMNCSAVWPAYESNASQDFGAAYYEKNIALAERQVAKAGVRMAAWFDKYLNDPSCSSTSRPRDGEVEVAGGKVGWLYQ